MSYREIDELCALVEMAEECALAERGTAWIIDERGRGVGAVRGLRAAASDVVLQLAQAHMRELALPALVGQAAVALAVAAAKPLVAPLDMLDAHYFAANAPAHMANAALLGATVSNIL